MGYKIITDDFPDFSQHLKDELLSTKSLENSHRDRLTFSTPKGDINYVEEVVENSVVILNGHYDFNESLTISGKGEEALCELHFNLSATDIVYDNPIRKNRPATAHSGNVTFLNPDDNRASIGFQKGVSYETFDIHLPVNLLTNLAGESLEIDSFLNEIEKGRSASLLTKDMLLNHVVENLLKDIKACNYQNNMRRIYLEAKVYEMVTACLQGSTMSLADTQFSTREVELIKETAHVIRENINKPFTILELSRRAGMNQTKLKSGFKHIFGETIFGYLTRIRMNNAREYLLNTGLSVQEISHISGYQSVSNFSIAFKRTFGMSPSSLRLENR